MPHPRNPKQQSTSSSPVFCDTTTSTALMDPTIQPQDGPPSNGSPRPGFMPTSSQLTYTTPVPATPTRQCTSADLSPVGSQSTLYGSPRGAVSTPSPDQKRSYLHWLNAQMQEFYEEGQCLQGTISLQNGEIHSYKTKLEESEKQKRALQQRETSICNFLAALVMILEGHDQREIYDIEDFFSSKETQNSLLELLSHDLATAQQARLFSIFVGRSRPDQADTACSEDEHIVPTGDQLDEAEDVKYSPDEMLSPYMEYNSDPYPTEWDLRHPAAIEEANCQKYEHSPPISIPTIPNTGVKTLNTDGKPYAASGGNVNWTDCTTALRNVDLSKPLQIWYITVDNEKICRWQTPSRTRSRTLLSWQTLPANASFDEADLISENGIGPAWSYLNRFGKHDEKTPIFDFSRKTCPFCQQVRHARNTMVHDFAVPRQSSFRSHLDDIPNSICDYVAHGTKHKRA